MSKATKKKIPKRVTEPRNHKPTEVVEGIVWRPENDEAERTLETKIVFLGKENLEKLRGYKAYLDLWPDKLRLTITGLSRESARFHFPLF